MLRELLKKATGKKKDQQQEATTSQPKAGTAKPKATAKKAASTASASKKAPAASGSKPASKEASKPAAKKTASKKAAVKKAPAKKAAAKPAAKPAAKKATTSKPAAKKAAAKKKSASTKSSAKKSASAAPLTKAPLPKANKPAQPRSHASVQVSRPVKKTAPSNSLSQATIHGFKPYQPAEGEEYMNEKQREHFRQILLAWRLQLMEEADRTMHHLQDEQANLPDPADRATQEEEFALELRTRDRERKLLKKIEKVLDKITKDDFGYCDACGIEIGIRRLEARPTADLCIDCKELAEIKEKQLAG